MIGFVVSLDLKPGVKRFSIRTKCWTAEAIGRSCKTRWFAAVDRDLKERRVCFGVGSCVSVRGRDEDDSVAFRCPDCIEFVARVADASGKATFINQLCTG